MSAEEQVAYESRVRYRQTAAAAAAGVLLMVATIVSITGYHAPVSEQTLNLIAVHRRSTRDIVVAVVNAFAEVAIAATLMHLWRCARARRAQVPIAIPILVLTGAVLSIVCGILYALELSHTAHQFVSTGAQTYDEADHMTRGAKLLLPQIGSQLSAFLVAIAVVLIALQAMRIGLLPRVLGYVGIVAAFLIVFPIVGIPIVQFYWLISVAYLVSGRWPSGLPPAWRSGQAEAWPAASEIRARRAAEAEAMRGRRAERKSRGRRGTSTTATVVTTEDPARPEAESSKSRPSAGTDNVRRKRKRRR